MSSPYPCPRRRDRPPSASLAVLILLNGLRTASTGLTLQFTQPVYDSALGQINTTALTTISQPIQLMYFAYLMVDLSSLSSSGFLLLLQHLLHPGELPHRRGQSDSAPRACRPPSSQSKKTAYLPCVGTTCTECQT
jgi:hypothetical protein